MPENMVCNVIAGRDSRPGKGGSMKQLSFAELVSCYETYFPAMNDAYSLESTTGGDWWMNLEEGRHLAGKYLIFELVKRILMDLEVSLSREYKLPQLELDATDRYYEWNVICGSVLEEFLWDCYMRCGWQMKACNPEEVFNEWLMEQDTEISAVEIGELSCVPEEVKERYLTELKKTDRMSFPGSWNPSYRSYFHSLAELSFDEEWDISGFFVLWNEKVFRAWEQLSKVPQNAHKELFTELLDEVTMPMERHPSNEPCMQMGHKKCSFAVTFMEYFASGEPLQPILLEPYKAVAAFLLDRLCDLVLCMGKEKEAA